MKTLFILLMALPLAVVAQEAPTAHGIDYADMLIDLLAFVGGSSVISAFLPSKVRTAIPVLNMALNFISANFLNAKNRSDKD